MSAKQEINEMQDDMGEMVQKGKHMAKKSAQDWFEYIKEHPLQSMLFGVAVFYALKGLLKN
jgi:hypothetical protein